MVQASQNKTKQFLPVTVTLIFTFSCHCYFLKSMFCEGGVSTQVGKFSIKSKSMYLKVCFLANVPTVIQVKMLQVLHNSLTTIILRQVVFSMSFYDYVNKCFKLMRHSSLEQVHMNEEKLKYYCKELALTGNRTWG